MKSVSVRALFLLALVACGAPEPPPEPQSEPELTERREALTGQVLEKASKLRDSGLFDEAVRELDRFPPLRDNPRIRELRNDIIAHERRRARARLTDPDWQVVIENSQGQVHFAFAGSKIAENPAELAKGMRHLCDQTRQDWCRIMVWSKDAALPSALPLTVAQLQRQVAQYSRNRATGHDCFYLLAAGRMVDGSRSGNC
jgi:hypothetical protein